MSEGEKVYLEDLSVGQRFESAPVELTAEAIKAFAAQFDPQPFHLDEGAAEGSFFRGLAASGWHVAGLTMRMLVDGTLPIASGLIGAEVEVAWPRPTRPGDVLRAVVTIEAIHPSRSKPDRGFVTVRTETLNQNDEPTQVMTSKMLVLRRP